MIQQRPRDWCLYAFFIRISVDFVRNQLFSCTKGSRDFSGAFSMWYDPAMRFATALVLVHGLAFQARCVWGRFGALYIDAEYIFDL